LPGSNEELKTAGIFIGGLGDAGEMRGEEAKVAYRRRLSELREGLEEAKKQGNVERAERAGQEIDALTREPSRAVGLGGRDLGSPPFAVKDPQEAWRQTDHCRNEVQGERFNWSSSALASFRSAVSKPSLNQLYISVSIARASARRLVSRIILSHILVGCATRRGMDALPSRRASDTRRSQRCQGAVREAPPSASVPQAS
jgi:hypothetical protein